MTEPRTPAEPSDPAAKGPPPPAPESVRDHEPPADEAEREVRATVRSVSRLEESN